MSQLRRSDHPSFVLFDMHSQSDEFCGLAPLTDLRPAFDVRTGALTTLERWVAIGRTPDALMVDDSKLALARSLHPDLPINDVSAGPAVYVNGRWPLGPVALKRVDELGPDQRTLSYKNTLLAAFVDDDGPSLDSMLSNPKQRSADDILESLSEFFRDPDSPDRSPGVLERPWHVRSNRDRCIAVDLHLLGAGADTCVDRDAWVADSAVLDDSAGPICIAKGARVGHFAVIRGPAYIGPDCTVMEHAVIRENTAIGPVCKVGGEVGGTIFQGYSNKAHDGYLGDSFVGQWVNLGAGTTNSNLLNTYGEIIIDRERTGETFLGCILGDHVKTAIGTRIMTGAIVGTGAMWAATTPLRGARPMTWAVDADADHVRTYASPTKILPYRLEKFLDVARAVMARRGHAPSQAEVECVKNLARQG